MSFQKTLKILHGDLYLAEHGTFIENQIKGQNHRWRIQVAYEDNAQADILRCILFNPVSGFRLEDAKPIHTGEGKITCSFSTYADNFSMLEPYGNGRGYEFRLIANGELTAIVEGITVFYEKKD